MVGDQYKTAAHRAARRKYVEVPIARQGFVLCVTCGLRITDPAEADTGHDHTDPSGRRYLGAQCRNCNRSDGGRRGAEVTNAKAAVPAVRDYGW